MNNKNLRWGLSIGGLVCCFIAVLCLTMPFVSFISYNLSGFDLLKLLSNSDATEDINILRYCACLLPVIFAFSGLLISISVLVHVYLQNAGKIAPKNKSFGYGTIILNITGALIPLVLFLFIPKMLTNGYDILSVGSGAILCGLFLGIGATMSSFAQLDFKNFNNGQQNNIESQPQNNVDTTNKDGNAA